MFLPPSSTPGLCPAGNGAQGLGHARQGLCGDVPVGLTAGRGKDDPQRDRIRAEPGLLESGPDNFTATTFNHSTI